MHNFYPRREDGSLFDTDGYVKVTIDQSRSLFRCEYTNSNLTRKKAFELHSNGSLLIPEGDFTVWTDGSKKKHYGASGICCVSKVPVPNSTTGISYSPIFSSFEIEVCAIRDGLMHLKENFDIKGKNVVLCTDSQSSVKHLISLSMKPRVVSSLVYELITVVDDLIQNHAINLNFCWIPGHGNIGLNDEVDNIAKNQLENSEEDDYIELSIPRTRIEQFNRRIEKVEFRDYLLNNVKDSQWDDYHQEAISKRLKT